MSRLAFIFRTDVHQSDRSPASWKGDYQAEVWDCLDQIGELARKYKADGVLDGGDYFHVKAATRNSHGIVAQTAEVHRGYPCPTYHTPGNHDIAYNNLDTTGKQPLGVLYAAGVFHQLGEHVFEGGGLRVRLVGVPYNPKRTLEELRQLKKEPGEVMIALVHALAAEKPPAHVEDFYGDPVFRYGDLVYDGGPDIWCFGHWHKAQGVVELQGRYFVNPGAVSRGALVRENLERVPQVALIEVTDKGVTVGTIPLTVPPAADVFDLERKERRETESQVIEGFIEHLQEGVDADPAASVEDNIGALVDFASDVRSLALDYLRRARGE
jgi:DNA repair exonuclease SbcCD nuclease subunit